MTWVFLISKIIGILLLLIVAAFITSICVFLFVPVRYSVLGDIGTGKPRADVKISWLLKIFRVKYALTPDGEALGIWVLWFDVTSRLLDAPPSEYARHVPEAAEYVRRTFENGESTSDDEPDPKPTPGDREKKEENPAKHSFNHDSDTEDEQDGIFGGIRDIVKTIRLYANIADREPVLSATKQSLAELLKAIWPRKIRLEGEIGLSSPHLTGYLFALIGVISHTPLTDLRPNFDEKVLRLNMDIRSSLRLWTLLWPLIKYVRKPPIRPRAKKLFRRMMRNE